VVADAEETLFVFLGGRTLFLFLGGRTLFVFLGGRTLFVFLGGRTRSKQIQAKNDDLIQCHIYR
jgi:hypothetical protein